MAKLVNIKTFYSRHEAETAKGLLKEKGIKSSLLADDGGMTRPSLAFTIGVKLLVSESDIQKAKKVLKILDTPKK